jgi:hypothetical protein
MGDYWRHVSKGDGCWLWTGSRRPDGYGVVHLPRGKQTRAHRLIYEAVVGPIPSGLHLMHTCDNPPCVNPAHLRPGTQRENLADMTAKGRRRSKPREQQGSKNAIARLTEEAVVDVRRRWMAGESRASIAARYDVDPLTAYYAAIGRTWTHVPMPEGTRPRSNYAAKLSPDDVATIHRRIAAGDTRAAIGRDYGVSAVAVSAIALGRTHRALLAGDTSPSEP